MFRPVGKTIRATITNYTSAVMTISITSNGDINTVGGDESNYAGTVSYITTN